MYAEQLSNSPFTAPRTINERSRLHRICPTVVQWGQFQKVEAVLYRTAPAPGIDLPLAPLRWDPIAIPSKALSFVEGIRAMTTAGDAGSASGLGMHLYLVARSMTDEYLYDADGALVFVPQQGRLRLATAFEIIDIEPGEIAVIPRGVQLRVELLGGSVLLLRRSMLTEKIARRGQHVTREYDVDPYELTRVGAIMVRDVDVLQADLPMQRAIEVLEVGRHRLYTVLRLSGAEFQVVDLMLATDHGLLTRNDLLQVWAAMVQAEGERWVFFERTRSPRA